MSSIEAVSARLDEHITLSNSRYKQLQELQGGNIEAIALLTKSTQNVVDAWVFVNTFGRFVKWIASFTVLGVAAKWLAATFSYGA